MRFLELKIPPVIVWLAFALAMWAVARWLPGAALDIPWRLLIAIALAAAGLSVGAAGVLAFRRHGTTLNPMAPGKASTVVDSGIFRHTRNPMYLGLALTLCGWATWLSSLAAFALVGLFVLWMTELQIRPEERALRRAFGQAFDDYVAKVRRWL